MFSDFYDYLKNSCDKTFYGYLTPGKPMEEALTFYLVDSVAEKCVLKYKISLNNMKKFIDELVLDKNQFLAIVVGIVEIEVKEAGYKSQHEFQTSLKRKLNQLQIPNYFMGLRDIVFATPLIAASVNIQYNETLLMVMHTSENVHVSELKFTPAGYGLIRSENIKHEIITHEKILGTSNPKKIILWETGVKHSIKKLIASEELTVVSDDISDYFDNFIIETCKWILDRKNVKYHILTGYQKDVEFSCYYGKRCNGIVLYNLKFAGTLPFTKAAIFSRTFSGCSISINSDKDAITFGPELERKNCHRFKAILSIDTETLESCSIEKVTLNSIHALPYHLEDVCDDSKVPVIGLFDISSVILTHKGCLGYDFLKSWNGLYGKDLFMRFNQKKPKYFEEAWTKLEKKHSFVIFDLLKIMSMPPDCIESTASWGFTITKDAENPVLLEFDSFDGSRKAASPSFLMAMFIRKHLKAIQEETGGEKPEEIAFWILNELNGEEQFDEDEMKRIKEGLEEACKLLKISCSFVDC